VLRVAPKTSVFLGIIFYLCLFYILQTTPITNHVSWIVLSVAVSVVTLVLVLIKSKSALRAKIIQAISVIIISFIISFTYSTLAYWHASKLCQGVSGWNNQESCANSKLPFPF